MSPRGEIYAPCPIIGEGLSFRQRAHYSPYHFPKSKTCFQSTQPNECLSKRGREKGREVERDTERERQRERERERRERAKERERQRWTVRVGVEGERSRALSFFLPVIGAFCILYVCVIESVSKIRAVDSRS